MNNKDKEILEQNSKFFKRVFKSAIYTFFIFLFVMFGLIYVFDLVFHGGDTSLIISFCVCIIFTVFYCTLTILEEIKEIKEKSSE